MAGARLVPASPEHMAGHSAGLEHYFCVSDASWALLDRYCGHFGQDTWLVWSHKGRTSWELPTLFYLDRHHHVQTPRVHTAKYWLFAPCCRPRTQPRTAQMVQKTQTPQDLHIKNQVAKIYIEVYYSTWWDLKKNPNITSG